MRDATPRKPLLVVDVVRSTEIRHNIATSEVLRTGTSGLYDMNRNIIFPNDRK